MTALRAVGLVVLIFLVCFPLTCVMHDGLPADEPLALGDEEREKDDPIVDVYCLKGLMAISNGQFDKAVAAYTEAIGRDPKYSFAYLGRGDAYMAKGDVDRARLDYEHALRLDPNNDAAKERIDAVRKDKAKQ